MNLSSMADAFGNNRSMVVISLLLRRGDRGGSAASAFQLVQVGGSLQTFFGQIWRGASCKLLDISVTGGGGGLFRHFLFQSPQHH